MIEEFQDDLILNEELQKESKVEPQDLKVTKKKKKKEIFGFILYVVFVFAFAYLIITFVGQRTVVIGHSMENTLADGDNLIVDKISYRFKEPERYDIIVFPYEYKEDTYYIKRIIGLPGETVMISSEGVIYINGKELKESYGREVIRNAGQAGAPIELKDGEYFVLGDNRNNSEDSRFSDVGIIHKSEIVGRAVFRIFPFDSIGTLK